MNKKSLAFLLVLVLMVALAAAGCSSKPSEVKKEEPKYPTKQVDLIVTFAPGGGNDLVGRAIGEYLTKEWGQPVNVINKPGGGGAIGVQEALKKSKPDGYTALVAGVTNSSALLAGNKGLPFTMDDFKWVSKTVEDPLAILVKADAPWKDLKEFAEWAKNNSDQLSYGTPGPSGIATYATAEFLDAIGADFSKARMITTTGGADTLPKVAGGHITMCFLSVSEASSMVKAGKVRFLAVTSPKRSQFFPDVPTAEEMGVKNLGVKWWLGIAMPAGTPDSIVKKWDDAIAKMSKAPAFLAKLKTFNAESSYMNSADVNKLAKEEGVKLSTMAEKKGLRK